MMKDQLYERQVSLPALASAVLQSMEREVGAQGRATDSSSYGSTTRFPSTAAGQGYLLEDKPAGFFSHDYSLKEGNGLYFLISHGEK